MIRFQCTKCGRMLKAMPEQSGKKTRCTACNEKLLIPDKSDAGLSAVSAAQPASARALAAGSGSSRSGKSPVVGAGGTSGTSAAVATAGEPGSRSGKSPASTGGADEALRALEAATAAVSGMGDLADGGRFPAGTSAAPAPAPVKTPAADGPTLDAEGRVKVLCACGKKYKIKAPDAAGSLKCTACGAKVRVPSLAELKGGTAGAPAAGAAAPTGPGSPAAGAAAAPAATPSKPAAGAGNVDVAAFLADIRSSSPSAAKAAAVPTAGTGSTEGNVPDADGKVRVKCRCGKKFRVKPGAIASDFKCTGCGRQVQVPAAGASSSIGPAIEDRKAAIAQVARKGAATSPIVEDDAVMSSSGLFPIGELLKDAAKRAKAGTAGKDAPAKDSKDKDKEKSKPGTAPATTPPGDAAAKKPDGDKPAAGDDGFASRAKAAVTAPAPISEDDQMSSSSGLFEVKDLMAEMDVLRKTAKQKAAAKKAAPGAKPADGAAGTKPAEPGLGRIDLGAAMKDLEAGGNAGVSARAGKPDDSAKPGDKSAGKVAAVGDKSTPKTPAVGDKSGKAAGVGDKPATAADALKAMIAGPPPAPPEPSNWMLPVGGGALGLGVIFVGYLLFSGGGGGSASGVTIGASVPAAVSADESDGAGLLRDFPTADASRPATSLQSVAYSPDGEVVVSGGADGAAYVGAIADNKVRLRVATEGVTSPATAVAVTSDGKRLAVGHRDGFIRLYALADGKPVAVLKGPKGHSGAVHAMTWFPDGKYLASGGDDRRVLVWDTAALQPGLIFEGHTTAVHALALNPDGTILVSGSGSLPERDQTIRVWSVRENRALKAVAVRGEVRTLALTPDGRTVIAAGDDMNLHFVDLESGADTALPGHTDLVIGLSMSPDGKRLFSIASRKDRSVRAWDVEKKRLIRTFELPKPTAVVDGGALLDGFRAVASSPKGRRVAVACLDGTTKIIGIGE